MELSSLLAHRLSLLLDLVALALAVALHEWFLDDWLWGVAEDEGDTGEEGDEDLENAISASVCSRRILGRRDGDLLPAEPQRETRGTHG